MDSRALGRKSKRKGKSGELEVAHLYQDIGYMARRTSQYCGSSGDASDVTGVPYIHIEVKRQDKMNLYDWLEQAKRDSQGTDNVPVVHYRQSRKGWRVLLECKDLHRIFTESGMKRLPVIFSLEVEAKFDHPVIATLDFDAWAEIYKEWEASKSLPNF
jgi:Holliday junction resolvase